MRYRQKSRIPCVVGYVAASGGDGGNNSYKRTPYIEYVGGNIIVFNSYNGSSSCAIAYYDENKNFISGIVGESTTPTRKDYYILANSVPVGTKYIRCSTLIDALITTLIVKNSNAPGNNGYFLPSGSEKMKILIFGDSITTCASFTINANNQTTAYQLNHPSNSYVKDGVTIRYDMWPYFVQQYLNAFDLRNYAYSGESYKYSQREAGNERQNLSYQIEVAENDLTNPNNVFPTVGNFVPDIVIFALGTNDGNPNDTYDSAMAKTIMNGAGTAVDVPATLANLDLTKFNEAVRYAFLKIKHLFPYALTMCVLPIQRAAINNNTAILTTMHDALKKMAERHSMVVIDGAFSSGIIIDNETQDGLGDCLKDGLHPNDKGQNLMARMILNAIKNNWIDQRLMNP